jgi:hypothetical protein
LYSALAINHKRFNKVQRALSPRLHSQARNSEMETAIRAYVRPSGLIYIQFFTGAVVFASPALAFFNGTYTMDFLGVYPLGM